MRKILCVGATVAAFPAAPDRASGQPAPSVQPTPTPEAEGWLSNTHWFGSWSLRPEDPDPDLSRILAGTEEARENSFVHAVEMPDDLRRKPVATVSVIAVDIDVSGNPTGCRVVRASSDPRLDRLACDRILATFRPRQLFSAPGRPTAARRLYAMGWETYRAGAAPAFTRPPPAPPPPPPPPTMSGQTDADWPRHEWRPQALPSALPQIQSLFPRAARRRTAMVSLDLHFTSVAGITDCRVGVSSGDAAMDEAACQVARSLDLSYREACGYCAEGKLPLQIVWRRGRGSHVRLPLLPDWPYWQEQGIVLPRDPADTRTATSFSTHRRHGPFAFRAEDFGGARVSQNYVYLDLRVDEEGVVRVCRPRRSIPDVPLLRAACTAVGARLRYGPATDIFGTPVGTRETFYGDLRAFD